MSMTDEQVEKEIKEILEDPDFKLAKKEQRLKYRRRQYLYNIRSLKAHGEELRKSGITEDVLEEMYREEA